MFTIRKRFSFSAGHRLTKVPAGHKCGRSHGHNYEVEIELQAHDLDPTGFVIDYGELSPLRNYLDQQFDHRMLNDAIEGEPTSEMLAWKLYTWCHRRWPQTTAVRVSETPQTWAEYRP